MAPKAKKKKQAANPDRGFATQSVASKPKVLPKDDTPLTTGASDNAESKNSTDTPGDVPKMENGSNIEAQALQNLSAEDLEARLEDADLQNLVDKISPKTSRDSSRFVTKMQTECRLLRGQALHCNLQNLAEERMSQILSAAVDGLNDDGVASREQTPVRSIMSEDDLVFKLWTLKRTLIPLGFSTKQIEDSLRYILSHPPIAAFDSLSNVWGFDECIDYIALHAEVEDLPVYDTSTGKPKMVDAPDVIIDPPSSQEEPADPAALLQGKASQLARETTDEAPGTPEQAINESDDDVSDLASDLDPQEIQSVFLESKAIMYLIDPAFEGPKKGRESRSREHTINATGYTSTRMSKLQEKVTQIERDPLFDRQEADEKWVQKRIQIARDMAAERRQQPRSSRRDLPNDSKRESEPRNSHSDDFESMSDDDNALGNLFSSVPSDVPTQNQSPTTGGEGHASDLVIRDFGVVKGIEPRRILEETCRARDPRVKITYSLISLTAFANRHNVVITWSKPTTFAPVIELESVSCHFTGRSCSLTMMSVATPDAQQSISYIAVVALFMIFAKSPREEKAHTRLPPAWRDLWAELVEQHKRQTEADEKESVRSLRALVKSQDSQLDLNDDVVLTQNIKKRNDNSGIKSDESIIRNGNVSDSHALAEMWKSRSSTASYQQMQKTRSRLPMWKFKDDALRAVSENQVTILCGETGCGKSTQMPAYILEQELSNGRACKIYCTEPRRISAITLAQRVSEELGGNKRDVGTARSLVGYAIRLESQITHSTRLVYATTGIVLRMLEAKDDLKGVTHVIIDEVHERSIETDFLLIILRSLIRRRPELKVILMSATVNAEKFSAYFQRAPILNVPGRTFPVETKFLEDAVELTGHVVDEDSQVQDDNDDDEIEDVKNVGDLQGFSAKTWATLAKMDPYRIDYTLIKRLIESVATSKHMQGFARAILVFLPGLAEIRQMLDVLGGSKSVQQYQIHTLHSSIASDEQQQAFATPPQGFGKIVLSTNIAETGVTIPDVTCVIDSGKHKEMRFDERRQVSRLIESFISRANAKQRRGRAGRVQQGLCFHLFTRARHDQALPEQQTPEMLRLSLQDLIMRVKICKLGDIQETLSEALDPPSSKNIRRAIDALTEVGALTVAEDLTAMGAQLSKLPLDPYLGKLVFFGRMFGILDVCLTLAAILTSKSPFVSPPGARRQGDLAKLAFRKGDSDLLTDFNAYSAWRRVCTTNTISEFQFCRKNLLSSQALSGIEDLKSQFLSALSDAGFIDVSSSERVELSRIQNSSSYRRRFASVPQKLDMNSANVELISTIIAWSLYPKILGRDGKGWRNLGTNQSISIHPTSIVRLSPSPAIKAVRFMSFYSILQSGASKNYNANSLTPVQPFPLLLLVGQQVQFHPVAHVVTIDGARLRFSFVDYGAAGQNDKTVQSAWKTYLAVKFLRKRLEEIVQRWWKSPGSKLPKRLDAWLEIWNKIVESWPKGEEVRT